MGALLRKWRTENLSSFMLDLMNCGQSCGNMIGQRTWEKYSNMGVHSKSASFGFF